MFKTKTTANHTIETILIALVTWIEKNEHFMDGTVRRRVLDYARVFEDSANVSDKKSDEWKLFTVAHNYTSLAAHKFYKGEINRDELIERIYDIAEHAAG